MKHLAHRDTGATSTCAREIAEQYDIPIELMAKVLQRLVRTGLLVYTRATCGGYPLSRSSASISVAEVIEAIDGPFTVTACSTDKHDCEQYGKCSIRDPLWALRERIVHATATVRRDPVWGTGERIGAALGTVTIAEIAAESVPVAATHAAVLHHARS